MTWLQGTSQWSDIADLITDLACGDAADDTATFVDAADQWIREHASQNLMRTPATEDVNTGTQTQRAGYFALCSYVHTQSPNAYNFLESVCRQTAVWSGVPSGVSNNKWVLFVRVETANSTPGTYSTAQVRWAVADGDTGTLISSGTLASPDASGNVSITSGTRTCTFQCTDPSGTLVVGTLWMRAATSVYVGGIDSFGPLWNRRTGNATFTVDPPGTVTTDYVKDVDIPAITAAQGITCSPSIYASGSSTTTFFPHGLWGGVGIKTVTALTGGSVSGAGTPYACSWDMAYFKMRVIPGSGATNGQLNLEWGGSLADDGGTFRRIGGFLTSAWMVPFTVPGSVDPSSALQYWISVKPNKIIIILNGDPGDSGVLTDGGMWSFTPIDYLAGSYDKFPFVVSKVPSDSTTQPIAVLMQFTYMQQVWRQDGSESRDWQTGWMRYDSVHITSVAGTTTPAIGGGIDLIGVLTRFAASGNAITYSVPGYNTNDNNFDGHGSQIAPFESTKPNAISGTWRMYGHPVADVPWWAGSSAGATTGNDPDVEREDDLPRGYVEATVDAPFLYLPGGNWASGDELTDTVSSNVFFLVRHAVGVEKAGILGAFGDSGAALAGGIAVLEE